MSVSFEEFSHFSLVFFMKFAQVKHGRDQCIVRTPDGTDVQTSHESTSASASGPSRTRASTRDGRQDVTDRGLPRSRSAQEMKEKEREIEKEIEREKEKGKEKEKERKEGQTKTTLPLNPYARYATITTSSKNFDISTNSTLNSVSSTSSSFAVRSLSAADLRVSSSASNQFTRLQAEGLNTSFSTSISTSNTPHLTASSPSPSPAPTPLAVAVSLNEESIVVIVASSPHIAMVVDSSVSLKPGTELFTVALGPKEKVFTLIIVFDPLFYLQENCPYYFNFLIIIIFIFNYSII